MTSITHQKAEVKREIITEIERRLREKPDSAHDIAVGMATSLASRMTLGELRGWVYHLFDAEREAAQPLQPSPSWWPCGYGRGGAGGGDGWHQEVIR